MLFKIIFDGKNLSMAVGTEGVITSSIHLCCILLVELVESESDLCWCLS